MGAPAAALSWKESAVDFWNEDVLGAALMMASIPVIVVVLVVRRRLREHASPREP
jgi:hypothetical protein